MIEFDEYLALSEDELFTVIGHDLDYFQKLNESDLKESQYPKSKKYLFDDASDLKKLGKAFFEENYTRLCKEICEEWNYCEKKENSKFNDNLSLATAVLEVVTFAIGKSVFDTDLVGASLVSILIQRGLDNMCACERDPEIVS